MNNGHGLPPGTSYGDLHRHIDGPEISPQNCDEKCCADCKRDVWLASEDKWFSEMCIEEYWLEELDVLIDNNSPDGEEQYVEDLLRKGLIESTADEAEEFTGFVVRHPDPWAKQEITIQQLEQIRNEIKEKANARN